MNNLILNHIISFKFKCKKNSKKKQKKNKKKNYNGSSYCEFFTRAFKTFQNRFFKN